MTENDSQNHDFISLSLLLGLQPCGALLWASQSDGSRGRHSPTILKPRSVSSPNPTRNKARSIAERGGQIRVEKCAVVFT